MTVAIGVQGARKATERNVKALLWMSAASLLIQITNTDYGSAPDGAAVSWTIVGLVLLWLVYRHRSRVARGFIVIGALTGAVIYGLGAVASAHSSLLALAYLGQAVPLLLGPVRRHVQAP